MPILPTRFQGGSQFADVDFAASAVQIGSVGGTTLATGTTSVIVPKPAVTSCQLLSVRVDALAAATSAGTVLLQVFKRDNSGTPTDRTLSGTRSLKNDVITVAPSSVSVPLTATSAQNLTFQSSDLCRVDIVSPSAPTLTAATITATWAIIKP